MIKKKVKSALPVYFIGLTWVVYGLFFSLYRWTDWLIAAALSAAVYFVSSLMIPDKTILVEEKIKPVKTGYEDVDESIRQGREAIARLKRANNAIGDAHISAQILRMEKACSSIYDVITAQPKKAPRVRKFMNYYLPTSVKLLESYQKLSNAGSAGDNIRDALRSVESSMEMIASAFEKQLDNLYEDEALDITTDVEVLESMMKSEGLMDDGGPAKA